MAIDKECTKNDIRIIMSVFSGDVMHTSTFSVNWLGFDRLTRRLNTANSLLGLGWSITSLRAVTCIVSWLPACEASP